MRARFKQAGQVQRITKAARFRGLPMLLVVPNLEITMLLVLSTGQTEAAMEMLVAYLMQPAQPDACDKNATALNTGSSMVNSTTECVESTEALGYGWFLLSSLICVGMVAWLFWVGALLRDFYRLHSSDCWVPNAEDCDKQSIVVASAALASGEREGTNAAALVQKGNQVGKSNDLEVGRIEEETVDDMAELLDDAKEEVLEEMSAIRRNMSTLFTMRRASRRVGAYQRPQKDAAEPYRTEAALALVWKGVFCRLPNVKLVTASAGLSLDMLTSFLDAGCPSRRGIFHTYLALLLQLIFAMIIGGLKGPGEADPNLAVLQVSLLGVTQLLMAIWAVCGDPSDKLLGLIGAICCLCELVSSCLLLAAHFSKGDLEMASNYATLAIDFFKVSIFAPLALALNDTLVVPIVSSGQRIIRRGHAENWSVGRTLCGVIIAILRLPFEFLVEVVGQVLPWVSVLIFEAEKQSEGALTGSNASLAQDETKPEPSAAAGYRSHTAVEFPRMGGFHSHTAVQSPPKIVNQEELAFCAGVSGVGVGLRRGGDPPFPLDEAVESALSSSSKQLQLTKHGHLQGRMTRIG
jgi:hypothetical protein